MCVCVCVCLLLSFYFLVLCCLTVTHNRNYYNRTQDLMPQHGKFISAQAIKAKTCTVTLKSSTWWPGYTPPPPPPPHTHTHTHTHKYPPKIDSLKLALPGRCDRAIKGRQGSAGLCSYFSSVTEHSTPAVLKFGGNPACAVRVLSVRETISFRTLQLGVCAGLVHAGYSRVCCGVRAFL